MEKLAKGTRGFLLFDGDGNPFFRVYLSPGAGAFVDYDILHVDLELEILDEFAVFREAKNGPAIDYSSKVLGRGSNDDDKIE